MNCIECKTAIERAIEDRETLSPAALEHTSTCASCQRVWELQEVLDSAIAAWRFVQPPAGFVDAVLEYLPQYTPNEFEDEDTFTRSDDLDVVRAAAKPIASPRSNSVGDVPAQASLRRARRSTGLALGSLVACLVVAVVFVSRFSNGKLEEYVDDMGNATSERRAKFAAVDEHLDVSSTITEVISDLRNEYGDFAGDTPPTSREVAENTPSQITNPVQSEAEDNDSANPDNKTRVWRPISSRVKVALGFLWLAVPGEAPSS